MVGAPGFEPGTSGPPCQRAAKLRYTPTERARKNYNIGKPLDVERLPLPPESGDYSVHKD